ncbi:hypothetical protein BaRGS_00035679 [Batillaria attramentaria]|uniref:Uncharacterized protein n=1 Tax=Batillaria attramentaria TaxID=370345 RepID=A0ABD0JE47_9CAEN
METETSNDCNNIPVLFIVSSDRHPAVSRDASPRKFDVRSLMRTRVDLISLSLCHEARKPGKFDPGGDGGWKSCNGLARHGKGRVWRQPGREKAMLA